jgi:apolipoprotein N-acyltransferase
MNELKQNLKHFVKNKPVQASIVSGLLFGCSFPPFPFPFQLLGLLAIAIWVEIIRGASSHRQALTYLFYGLLPANLVVSYWLTMATIGGGIAAVLAKAVVMSLMLFPFILLIRTTHYKASIFQVFVLTAAWIFAEGIDLYWDLSYPWLWIGNAWAEVPILYQYISFTGIFGLSAWVVFTALFLHKWLFLSPKVAEQNKSATVFISIVLMPVICSISMYYFAGKKEISALPDSNKLNALLVQPNHDSYAEYSGFSSYTEALDALIAQTDSAITKQTEIIYWPENALDPYLTNRQVNVYQMKVQNAVTRWGIPLVTGSTYREYYDKEKEILPLVVRNRNTQAPVKLFNSAVAFQPFNKEPIIVYKKMRLVPLVEKLPFEEFLVSTHLFGFDWEEWSLFGKGKDLVIYDLIKGKKALAPALICYDSAYPELGFLAANGNANYLAVITNDGWWGNSSGHIQHLALSRLRAVESGKWLVRAANNGISGVISPKGNLSQETEYWTKTSVSATIPLINDATFFSTYGNWFFYLCCVVVLVGFIINEKHNAKTLRLKSF